jgi:hypothetical protein
MSVQLYKPNPNNTGIAFAFKRGQDKKTKEARLYVDAIKQASWDKKTRSGSFKENQDDPEKNITVKFSLFECGEIIRALENGTEWDSFHSFDSDKTTIKVGPYARKSKKSLKNEKTGKFEDKWIEIPGFSFGLTRNGTNNFRVGIEQGEAEVICTYLKKIILEALEHRDKETQKRLKQSWEKQKAESESEDAPF